MGFFLLGCLLSSSDSGSSSLESNMPLACSGIFSLVLRGAQMRFRRGAAGFCGVVSSPTSDSSLLGLTMIQPPVFVFVSFSVNSGMSSMLLCSFPLLSRVGVLGPSLGEVTALEFLVSGSECRRVPAACSPTLALPSPSEEGLRGDSADMGDSAIINFPSESEESDASPPQRTSALSTDTFGNSTVGMAPHTALVLPALLEASPLEEGSFTGTPSLAEAAILDTTLKDELEESPRGEEALVGTFGRVCDKESDELLFKKHALLAPALEVLLWVETAEAA